MTDCLSHIRDNCVQSNFAMEVLNRLLDVLDTPDEPGRLFHSMLIFRALAKVKLICYFFKLVVTDFDISFFRGVISKLRWLKSKNGKKKNHQ